MKTIHTSIKTTLLILTTLALSATIGRADNYSWTNLQSDIPGVAAHTDPNLVNPWGMAASSSGSTIYGQDGTARSLIVTIPPASKNKNGGVPTGVVRNDTAFFKVTKNGNSQS